MTLLQRDLCQRFNSNDLEDTSRGEKSTIQSDTTNNVKSFSLIEKLDADKSTVDTIDLPTQIIVSVQKSDKIDIEVVSKEQLNEMADVQNSIENGTAGGENRRFSISEETEANDKFPQQISTKNANWNTMELGEKRKRLR